MNGAEEELERRSKFLNSLIQKKKSKDPQENDEPLPFNVRVRASDMPIPIQSRAFLCARSHLDSMPGKLDSKRLALVLKKVRNFFPNLVCFFSPPSFMGYDLFFHIVKT